ncbi:MAG: acyl-CoA dehydrogenase [Sphaerotilus natans subsp. sulfidivorans]|uniref:acyl-CoA dehydrogenase n=1 Tax=Sphaerotilus sulfidivorans TaxID=639200 RepID=UPI0023525CE5|nr:acyl-CoA dehydrogenase [Sphaerotilus sulfidivorans]MCK6401351.1 acyl-CoA dehydrogenase [Sphaerotilus sulfidivorans]
MNAYSPPLQDMRFVLSELSDLALVSALPETEALTDPELLEPILEQAARFAREVLAPLNASGDREGAHWSDGAVRMPQGFRQAWDEFMLAGWNNIALPAEHGGQGLPILLCTALQEMFTSANKAFCYGTELTEFAVKALIAAASDAQKQAWLPHLVSGRWSATMNLTEPQAGSDVGALRARAMPAHDGSWRLFGQKIFISYGEHDLTENILHLVLARLPGAPEGSAGVSLFAVPRQLPDGSRNDVRCTGIEHKLGNHASPTCTLVYGGEGEGATGWLVGREHKGLQAMFVMVNSARLTVGQEGTAMSERAYQQALAYARERVQGRPVGGGSPVPIIRHPDVRRMLLTMRCQTEAMRAVAYLLGASRDLAARHPDAEVRRSREAFLNLMIPVFKGWATETAVEVTSMSIQVHGGVGYVEESGVSQPLRDVRVATIYEGTTSIQAHDLVERKLVRDGGAALREWLARVHGTLQRLDAVDAPELVPVRERLCTAVAALQRGCEHVFANFATRPASVLGGSVPLLRLFGLVAGGWQMANAALAAHRLLNAGSGDPTFLTAKIDSARFYALHLLPQASGLAEVACSGGDVVMAMAEEAF